MKSLALDVDLVGTGVDETELNEDEEDGILGIEDEQIAAEKDDMDAFDMLSDGLAQMSAGIDDALGISSDEDVLLGSAMPAAEDETDAEELIGGAEPVEEPEAEETLMDAPVDEEGEE